MPHNCAILDGYPSFQEIQEHNGWPSEERFSKGPVAVIECVQPIPCNPCESACSFGAIYVGNPITNIPQLDREKCTGCGQCIPACSGLAIFMIDKSLGDGKASVGFPFEYLPLPKVGDKVPAVGRDGAYVCDGVVLKVQQTKKSDHTPVVTLEVPLEQADVVRSMARPGQLEQKNAFRPTSPNESLPDDLLVCRCEEVTAGEIRRAIRELKGRSVTEVKRRVRCGMGLCQGKSCGKLVTRIIAQETGLLEKDITAATDRPPVRPITFGELAGGDLDE